MNRRPLISLFRRQGFTLLEALIGMLIISIIAISVYQAFALLLKLYGSARIRIAATTLANEQVEIIRNLTYQNIGTVNGIPFGAIPQTQTKTKDGISFEITTAIRNIDDPFDGMLGGMPNDLAPADYKLAEIIIRCVSACEDANNFIFTSRFAPKNLETSSGNGALFIQVIDASGIAVFGASVHVVNSRVNPTVDITDTTDNSGFLKIVDVKPGTQSYAISVSKSEYSSDQTYATSTGNPNPTKPYATVTLGTVTQTTFSIDHVSTLNVSSRNATCGIVPNISFGMTGSRLIGTNPNIPKFNQTYTTDGAGVKTVQNLEWDAYTFAFSNPGNDIAGTIPQLPLNISPNATFNLKLIMEPVNPSALLVTVKDGVTGLPLSGASVTLSKTGYNATLMTGRGFLRQTDWSGGSGQTLFTDPAKYESDDSNVETSLFPGEIKLKKLDATNYAFQGTLTSSIFNTGSPSNFYNIAIAPLSQPPDAGPESLKFQLATATTSTPLAWNYVGPNGTAGTYYSAADTNINPLHNGNQYFRYKAYLHTASTTFTPNFSDIAFTFASDCVPPGQAFFNSLANDIYTISVSKTGYQTITDTITVALPWQERIITLIP